jgi:hypothetical protein
MSTDLLNLLLGGRPAAPVTGMVTLEPQALACAGRVTAGQHVHASEVGAAIIITDQIERHTPTNSSLTLGIESESGTLALSWRQNRADPLTGSPMAPLRRRSTPPRVYSSESPPPKSFHSFSCHRRQVSARRRIQSRCPAPLLSKPYAHRTRCVCQGSHLEGSSQPSFDEVLGAWHDAVSPRPASGTHHARLSITQTRSKGGNSPDSEVASRRGHCGNGALVD